MHFLSSVLQKKGIFRSVIESMEPSDEACRIDMADIEAQINTLKKNIEQLSNFLKNPMIQNPTNPNDDFGEKMSSFCSTAERQLALLLKKKTKMVEEYENLAKWLIFDAKKMPSKELFALLSEVKNDLVNAEIQNKERVEKEAKLKLQAELRQQQLAKTAARRQNKIGKFFLI